MLPAKPQAIVLGDEDPAMSQENTTLALIGTDDPAQGSSSSPGLITALWSVTTLELCRRILEKQP